MIIKEMKYFTILILLFQIKEIYSFYPKQLLENVNSYINELCSYNGIAIINDTSNEITCECNSRYANEPNEQNRKYINGHMIQCSYERKSRFLTIFLCLCIPFGFDFLYLKKYIPFSIFFTLSIIVLIFNIFIFFMNIRINTRSKETIIQIRLKRMINEAEEQKKKEKYQKLSKISKICKISTVCHLFLMIIVLILHLFGQIKDGNDVPTENDLGYMFRTPESD